MGHSSSVVQFVIRSSDTAGLEMPQQLVVMAACLEQCQLWSASLCMDSMVPLALQDHSSGQRM